MKKTYQSISNTINHQPCHCASPTQSSNGNGNPGSGNTPVGGGVLIVGGMGILLATDAAYGGKKMFQAKTLTDQHEAGDKKNHNGINEFN